MNSKLTQRLAGRVCVVAGCASPLGQSIVDRFIAEGASVAGVDKVAHSTGDLAVIADFSDEDQAMTAYRRISEQLGRIDVIVNNFGSMDRLDRSALETSVETWDSVFSMNLKASWLSCKHGIPHLLRNQSQTGSVINVSSFLVGMGSASAQMAMNAANAGVEQLSRDLGVQLARRGVRVNALSLGPIETPQTREMFAHIGEQEAQRRFVHMPMGRFGTLDEFCRDSCVPCERRRGVHYSHCLSDQWRHSVRVHCSCRNSAAARLTCSPIGAACLAAALRIRL